MVQQPVARVRAEAAIERRSALDAEAVTVPSTAVRAYLRSFQLVALVCSGGRISVSRDPFRPMGGRIEAVWWVGSAAQALEVMHQCELEESLDVYSVAQGLGVQLTPNDAAIANAERSVACLDARMAQAQNAGLLKTLNTRYRRGAYGGPPTRPNLSALPDRPSPLHAAALSHCRRRGADAVVGRAGA